ncbi:MAG: response regulator transcription factor [Acidobacteriota bacterium]|nr:response regulator transcription factor [Acidobacteriota bacterium]MDH3529019.1 response regulator transcription factor [Acidobacteriota bacterium]
MVRILIVEDEKHIADGLVFNLDTEGFSTAVAEDGETALEMVRSTDFDAIVLDVMLPNITGFEVAKKLRDAGNFTPILMLTARSRPEDVLEGFAAGADDYLPKPFELKIFLARLNGLLRRQSWSRKEPVTSREVIEFEGKKIDFTNLELTGKEGTVRLTLMEANLLRHFIKNTGTPVSRKELLEKVWGLNEDTDTRAIDNFVVRLRRYIEDDPGKPRILKTIRGIGYMFDPKEMGD